MTVVATPTWRWVRYGRCLIRPVAPAEVPGGPARPPAPLNHRVGRHRSRLRAAVRCILERKGGAP